MRKRLIDLNAAADELGVNVRTVRRYIAAGILPAYRTGPRLIRIDPKDLEQVARPIPTAGGDHVA